MSEWRWWQRGVIYQVYPRSFQDANADGVGDLRGIRQRLDHLEWLGVDAVWLSPIFRSPMVDFGYDVAEYRDVDPLFGTLEDLDALVDDLHRRGMRMLLDFVPNHTSSQHPWFIDAVSSRSAPHRDWYIWRDAVAGGESPQPPNDRQSAFGGSAWEWHEPTGQHYFHSFLKEQPDLDWTNLAVRAAMCDVLRFWFGRGIDGFRIDVVNLLAKDPEQMQPIVAELRAVANEFEDRVLAGEAWVPPEQLVGFYGVDGNGLHLPFNFQLIELPWEASGLNAAIARYEGLLPASGWPNWVLGNHDRVRIATRVGAEQARVAAMLLLTLRGTPTVYNGDEIGMTEASLPREAWRDPQGLRGGETRDGCRTPMRWDASPGGGFSSAEPWLPAAQPVGIDVASQVGDPDSMLSLYRALLRLRRAERALNVGEWHELGAAGTSLAYMRSDGERRFLMALNLAGKSSPLPKAARGLRGTVVISTLPDGSGVRFEERRELASNEGLLILLD